MNNLNKILVIAILIFIFLLALVTTIIIIYSNFNKEKKKLRREYIITLNNDKIKDYKEFYSLNKNLKSISKKIESRAIPNWINVESYYRDEFIIEYEEALSAYEFMSNYIEGKDIRDQASLIINKSMGIINELRERENFGVSSDEVEGEAKKIMICINSLEKNILSRVIELTKEKSKL